MIDEEEFENKHDDENEDGEFFRDKIFDNDFEQTELDTSEKKFSLDSNFAEKTLDDKIDESMFNGIIVEFIQSNYRLSTLNTRKEDGTFPKINKSEINEIYRSVTEAMSYIPKIEVFSIVTSIYDISPEKFYESLSNTFKTELITELKSRGYLKNLKSLF
jgi:hypothetical protein